MQFCIRRLARGEVDHELIWLSISVVSLGAAATWLAIGLPWPACMFHQLTGLPCVTCGMTRCAIQFFHGQLASALKWNPLVFLVLCGVTAYDAYAFTTIAMRAPRLRIHLRTQTAKILVRVSVVCALALNWVYLLSHWRDF
jgi:hypothetical protein